LVLSPKNIVDVEEQRLRRIIIQEYLVIWRGFLVEDATWEGQQILQHPHLEFLEDKQSWEGRTVMSPSN
jgi:hypothetical protein